MSFYDILRPMECPICKVKHPLRKHGTYNRRFCDLDVGVKYINILRYYCQGCSGTVSFLPSFAIPRRRFSSGIISICLQLIFACGVSLKGINRAYSCVSRAVAGIWIKRWYYNSHGIISVMRNYFGIQPQPAVVCLGHNSRYITPESLEAFFVVSDFIIGDELCDCHGICNSKISSCDKRYCFDILKGIQERYSKLPLSVELL